MKILYFAAFFAALGGILSGFDTGVISGALLYIRNDFSPDEFMQGALVSSALLGAVFGAVSNGALADFLGRKKVIFISAIIFFIGSILCAAAPNIHILIISRAIIGFGIGIVTFCAPLYLSEISPEKIRGALVSMFQLAITAGILVSYLTNALFAHYFGSWRLMLLAGVIPAAILTVGIIFLPDTPRWYVLSGQIEKAENLLARLKTDVKKEVENIKKSIETPEKKMRLDKRIIFPLLIGIGGMFIQQWTGINTIIYFAPSIMQNAGFDGNVSAIYASLGIGIVNFLMTFVAIFTVDKIGRKPLLYIGLTGMGISLLMLASSFKFQSGEARYFSLLSTALYIMFFAISLGPVMILLVSEVFPLKVRSLMMSISMTANFIFNFSVTFSFLFMLKAFGEFYTFLLFALISFLSIPFIRFVIPETKGKSLETIEKSWGRNV